MARTHGSRLTQLEEAAMRFILKAERLELENERLKARIEKLEAARDAPREGSPPWRDVNFLEGARS